MESVAVKIFSITGALFCSGFFIIAFTHKVKKTGPESKREMWKKFFWYFLIVNVFLGAALLGRAFFYPLVLAISALSATEFFRMSGTKGIRGYAVFGTIASAFIILAAAIGGETSAYLSALFGSMLVFLIPVFRGSPESAVAGVSATVLGILFTGLLPAHLVLIYEVRGGEYYIAFMYILLMMNDGFSQLTGRLLGRRKIRPDISPNKTLAGSAGGLLSAIAGSLVFRFVLPDPALMKCIAAGVIIGICGQAGDFAASAFKRDAGLKDFGTLLPGQGGILDRFDGLIFCAPVYYFYLILIS